MALFPGMFSHVTFKLLCMLLSLLNPAASKVHSRPLLSEVSSDHHGHHLWLMFLLLGVFSVSPERLRADCVVGSSLTRLYRMFPSSSPLPLCLGGREAPAVHSQSLRIKQ